MSAHHIYESRTAGCNFLLSLFIGFAPLFRLVLGRKVAAEPDFNEFCEAQFFHGFPPAGHGDVRSELSLRSRSQHRIYVFSCVDRIDHIHDPGLGTDGSERTAVDAFAAADTFLFIYYGNAVLII